MTEELQQNLADEIVAILAAKGLKQEDSWTKITADAIKRLQKKEPDLVADAMIKFLRRIHKLDPNVLQKLLLHRTEVNDDLSADPAFLTNKNSISVLGLLNSFCGLKDGFGKICLVLDEDGSILKIGRTEDLYFKGGKDKSDV